MILSVDNLKSIGAFTGAPMEKEITWKQGDKEHKATVFVRPLSYQSTVADLQALNANKDQLAVRIATAICDEKGNPVFTADDITGDADPERGALDGNLTMALLAVIAEVNSLGKNGN
ncbi:MAG TPA: phage tail protein [Nitrospiraceae bacterium]|nr:phage tail protein [Nitrospiraceae bacterium]